ncbi:hypothetical protein ANT2_3291 [plant metagenome]|uniref:Uncharacterized protein n=1 Tax=plant metagenome TaxID=1297885 RepID=A0A484QTM1_9ZZZZ
MDMNRAIQLIGTASDDPVMVAFLMESGVTKMPDWQRFEDSAVALDSGAVILQFSAEVPKGKEDCEPGTIFLEDITFSNPATTGGIGPLTQSIPDGLRIEMDSPQVKRLLGEPAYEGEFLGGLFLNYDAVRLGVDLSIKFDKAGRAIRFIRYLAAEDPSHA